MNRKSLSKLKIEQLRDILTSLDPLVPIKIRGINKKYLINKILKVNPVCRPVKDFIKKDLAFLHYFEWIATVNRLSHFPIITLDDHEIKELITLTKRIYEDYEKLVEIGSFILPLQNFLYHLSTNNISQLLDQKNFNLQTEKLLSHGRDRPYQEVPEKVLADTLVQEYGVLVYIENLIGNPVYKLVTRLERIKWRTIRENLLNISSKNLYEANAIMRDLYNHYTNLQRGGPCHPYFTFLILFPQYIKGNDNIKNILYEMPLAITTTPHTKLLEIYGDYCYDRNFLGQHVLPLSKELPERKYIIMIISGEVKSAIIFSRWSNVEDHIRLNYPDLINTIDKHCQQKHQINENDSLMIFRASMK